MDKQELLILLETLQQYDVTSVFNGEFTELSAVPEEDGQFVKVEDIKKLINIIKK
jgi:hypothetical protein